RYIILAGLLLCAGTSKPPKAKRGKSPSRPMTPPEGITDQLTQAESRKAFVDGLVKLFNTITNKSTDSSQKESEDEDSVVSSQEPRVFLVSLNRRALPALEKSVPAVKGDAARTLFKVSCNEIHWAVVDSGIDGSHPAFQDEKGLSRIIGTVD